MTTLNKKHEDILKTAKDLFWKHGFKRVSVEEVCEKANVSKMTFYKHFENKIELAKTVFNKVVEEGEQRFKQIMKESSPAPEKIKKLILIKIEGTNNISSEFMQDFYQGTEPELKAFVEERTRKSWELLINDIKKAQEEGIFRKDFKPEFLIKVQNKLIEVLEDESIVKMYDSQQALILEFTNLLVYGISQHE
jgi:AcrR family transcriptional regulator